MLIFKILNSNTEERRMKMIIRKFLIISLITLNPLPLAQANINFIGLNKRGDEVNFKLSKLEATQRVAQLINAVEKNVDLISSSKNKFNSMQLSELYLGLGLGTALGIGDIIDVSVNPSFYLIFKPN